MHNVVGLLLAAGKSERFGDNNKLLYPDKTGNPIGLSSARNLVAAVKDSIVVVRSDDLEFQSLLQQHQISFIKNENPDSGLSSSIVTGVRHASNATGWLILLGDMPYIDSRIIADARDLLVQNPEKLIVSSYDSRWGHPVGFGATFRQELLSLEGDQGAKSLLLQHQDKILFNETNSKSVLKDIDVITD
jgi:molybdenum cofactor cytidylyltransferase